MKEPSSSPLPPVSSSSSSPTTTDDMMVTPDLSESPPATVAATLAATVASVVKKMNLFDYTEEELYCSNSNTNTNKSANSNKNNSNSKNNTLKFNHYELLQIPIHATSYEIKKAYRKLSLQYHPDKTGRDENDYGTFVYIYVYLCFVSLKCL